MTSPYKYNDDKDTGLHTISEPERKHPDALNWKKCCGVCGCRKSKGDGSTDLAPARTPKGLSRIENCSTYFGGMPAHEQMLAGERPFYCTHRKDEEGNFLVCAGWYVKYGPGKKVA